MRGGKERRECGGGGGGERKEGGKKRDERRRKGEGMAEKMGVGGGREQEKELFFSNCKLCFIYIYKMCVCVCERVCVRARNVRVCVLVRALTLVFPDTTLR